MGCAVGRHFHLSLGSHKALDMTFSAGHRRLTRQGGEDHGNSRDCSRVARSSRTRLLDCDLALVEDVQTDQIHRGVSEAFQLCLPYQGVFIWRVAGHDVVGDANQILFVSKDEDFEVLQRRETTAGELIITPTTSMLEELTGLRESDLARHPSFRARKKPAPARLQFEGAVFRARAHQQDATEAETRVLYILRRALGCDRPAPPASAQTLHLIRRTKEFLDAHINQTLSLTAIAREVRASPTYLTDAFRRIEGMSLHRYLVQLRLSRALLELRDADDLTALALDLGFSSHSHFTAAFRTAFGSTPSGYRALARNQPALQA